MQVSPSWFPFWAPFLVEKLMNVVPVTCVQVNTVLCAFYDVQLVSTWRVPLSRIAL